MRTVEAIPSKIKTVKANFFSVENIKNFLSTLPIFKRRETTPCGGESSAKFYFTLGNGIMTTSQ